MERIGGRYLARMGEGVTLSRSKAENMLFMRGLVEPRGIEPLTSAVRLQRSPI